LSGEPFWKDKHGDHKECQDKGQEVDALELNMDQVCLLVHDQSDNLKAEEDDAGRHGKEGKTW
jgi:hypothetical protein